MTTPKTSARGAALSSSDPLGRAIAGAKQLRDAGFHPAVVQVGEARLELAVPVYVQGPGRPGGAGTAAQAMRSMAHEYLPPGAADALAAGEEGRDGADPDGGDDDLRPAVRR